MGLFSWFADKLSDAVEWVSEKAEDAKWWMSERIDDAKDFVADLFGRNNYTGKTVQEVVDAEKVLAKFKEDIIKTAKEAEDTNFKNIVKGFDLLTEELQKSYPAMVPALEKKREEMRAELEGGIGSYVEKHISENDPEFQKLLIMQPGGEKAKLLRQRMDTILQEAQKTFNKGLETAIKALHDDFSSRLSSELSAKEQQLEKELQDITDLTRQVDSGTVDLEKYENERLVLAETADCLEAILEQGERET